MTQSVFKLAVNVRPNISNASTLGYADGIWLRRVVVVVKHHWVTLGASSANVVRNFDAVRAVGQMVLHRLFKLFQVLHLCDLIVVGICEASLLQLLS